MAIKTYRTRELRGLSLHIFVEGDVRTSIIFKGGCTLGSTATYTTANPKIQKAIEALNSYGKTFYLESETKEENEEIEVQDKEVVVEPEVVDEEKEVVDILDAQTFKNLVELRNALKDKGVDASGVTNVRAAENLAKKHGYNYTVEKNA